MKNILKTSALALVLAVGLSGCAALSEWWDGMMGITEESTE